jgi:predicted DNA-binding transcriptional regulator AlpA
MQTQAKIQKWFSKRQVAERYGVHPRSIERWTEAGKFPRGTQLPSRRWAWSDRAIEEHERALVGSAKVAA